MGNEPTEVEREEKRSKGVEKWQITRCWEVLFSFGPRAWSTPGTPDNSHHVGLHPAYQANSVTYSSSVH